MKEKVDPVVDEAIETLDMKDGPARRKLLKGAGAVQRDGGRVGADLGLHLVLEQQRGIHEERGGKLPQHAEVAVLVR